MRSTVVACGATSTRTGSLRKLCGEAGDLGRHGRGEERRLPARVQRGDDLPHRLDEAHVEHAVGLVEHDEAGLVEHDRAVVHQVGQPARRGDDDVDAAGHRPDLGAARHAAEDEQRGEPGAAGEGAEGRLDLHRELAGRGEDQRAAGLRRRAAVPSSRSWCRIGSAKAAVLPVPVWAMPRMSRPASCGAIACAWIGVGVSKPARASAWVSGSARPKSAKVVVVTSIPFRAAVAAAVCRPRQAHVTKTA